MLATLRAAPKVAFVSDPFTTGTVSPDGRVAFAQATYSVPSIELTEADRETLLAAAAAGRAAGLTVEVGGDALQALPEQGASEAIGILIAAVVLFVTFGSFVAAGLPLLTALMGIGIGVGLITAATGFVALSATTSILAVMIGLAVSIDYALFILSRFRSELADDAEPRPARGHRAGRGHGGQCGLLRRSHGGHRAHRALGGRHPDPDRDGRRGRGHRGRGRDGRGDAPAGPHRLRRPPGAGPTHRAPRQGQPRAGAQDRLASLADVHLAPAVARARGGGGAPRSSSPCPPSTCASGCPTTASRDRPPPSARPTTCSRRASVRASMAR